ncbi:MAG: hypothetical protein KGJ88_13785 [Verrucomicrobiota bacterium]|nr:hypothetical protein [Verrucomicrobiota bacterium]
MKTNSAGPWKNGINRFIWIALLLALPLISANAQAPSSIAGKTSGVGITGGDGNVFANGGFFLFVAANSGNGFQVFNPDGSIETGADSSYSASGPTTTAILTVSTLPGYTINGKFYFMTPLAGANFQDMVSLTTFNCCLSLSTHSRAFGPVCNRRRGRSLGLASRRPSPSRPC